MRPTQPIEDRIFTRLGRDPETDCWIWLGPVDMAGYGVVSRGGRGGGLYRTHRFVFGWLRGGFTPGLELDHLCRNRRCCNPDHLEEVTHKDNCLRGRGPSAIHAMKTHCVRGHPFDGDNLHLRPSGGRRCRKCDADKKREKRLRETA